MLNRQPNAFHRAFPARDLFHGPARSVLFWSIINGLFLALLLADLFLIIDLLNHRGRITVRGQQNVQMLQDLRDFQTIPPDADQAISVAESTNTNAENKADEGVDTNSTESQPEEKKTELPLPVVPLNLTLTDSGILPSVWWIQNKYKAGVLKNVYQRFPLLQENQSALFTLILIALILASIRLLIRWRSRQLSQKISQLASMTLRNMLHRQSLRLGPGDLSEKETNQAFHLFITEVSVVESGVFQWVYRLSRQVITLLILLLFTISIDWRLTFQCMIPLAAAWYFLLQHRKEYEIQNAKTKVSINNELSLLAENLRSTRLVRGYGMETVEHERFQNHLEKYTENTANLKRNEGWVHRIARGLAVFCSCLVVFLVGYKVLLNPESLPLSAAILIVGIFAFFYLPVNRLYELIKIRSEANIAASSIYRYLNQIPEVSQAVGAKFLEPLSQALQFENVSYKLSGQASRILKGFDLKIPAGTSTALVSLEELALGL